MKQLIKPNALKHGDTIATVSLSWGGAGALRERYDQGKRQFEQAFGVKIVEMPHALDTPDEVYDHPEHRLSDWMAALQNPEIKGILTNIGGDDTIRLLRHMTDAHFDIIRSNPKVFMGMSDTTVNHLMNFKAGVSSFYSAALMFGYAENGGIPDYMIQNTRKTLFDTAPIGVLPESKEFIIDFVDWGADSQPKRPRLPSAPWRYISGAKTAQGCLIGGCFDVFSDIMGGTPVYPDVSEFEGSILFLEDCEEAMPPQIVTYWLRNLGARGILERISGLLFARPGNGRFADDNDRATWLATYPQFDEAILKILKEYGRADLPVVTNMDFGHTVPQLILPYGALCEINPTARTVSILESGVK